jgi:hypothetical protein
MSKGVKALVDKLVARAIFEPIKTQLPVKPAKLLPL